MRQTRYPYSDYSKRMIVHIYIYAIRIFIQYRILSGNKITITIARRLRNVITVVITHDIGAMRLLVANCDSFGRRGGSDLEFKLITGGGKKRWKVDERFDELSRRRVEKNASLRSGVAIFLPT